MNEPVKQVLPEFLGFWDNLVLFGPVLLPEPITQWAGVWFTTLPILIVVIAGC